MSPPGLCWWTSFGTPDEAQLARAVAHRDQALLRRLKALAADQADTGK